MAGQGASAHPSFNETTSPATRMDNAPASIEMPDFSIIPVMLSPSIRKSSKFLETYIHNRSINMIPLPTEPDSTSPLPTTPPPTEPSTSPKENVILLVEAANEDLTDKVIKSLVPHIPSYCHSISIWNWEILKIAYDDGSPPNPSAPLTKDMYIGRMTYDAPDHEVLTTWHDGTTERTRLLPDLLKHPVMLSPCVSGNMRILEEYLPGRLNTIIPHPSPGITPRPPPPNATAEQKKIIFLIDSKNTSATSKHMGPVAGFLPGSGYDSVEMWHWKVLKGRVEKCFYATMRVDKDGGGGGRDVSTVWNDGKVTIVRVGEGGRLDVIQKQE